MYACLHVRARTHTHPDPSRRETMFTIRQGDEYALLQSSSQGLVQLPGEVGGSQNHDGFCGVIVGTADTWQTEQTQSHDGFCGVIVADTWHLAQIHYILILYKELQQYKQIVYTVSQPHTPHTRQ